MRSCANVVVLGLMLSAASVAWGNAPASTNPTSTTPPALGPVFKDPVAGIAFNAPVGGLMMRQVNSRYLVRFVYPKQHWDIRLKLTSLSKPVPLSQPVTGNNPGGMLQMTTSQAQLASPSMKLVSSAINQVLWKKPIGLIISRANTGSDRVLTQTAIIPGEDSQTYYLLQFNSPARQKASTARLNPVESAAETAFDRTLASVQLLNRMALKLDQDQRLFRTRKWLATLDQKKIMAAVQPKQYLEILHDGKDVGFSIVLERPATRDGQKGIEIISRSHVVAQRAADQTSPPTVGTDSSPTAGELVPSSAVSNDTAVASKDVPLTIDRLANLFVSFDRRHEIWNITTNTGGGANGVVTTAELGNSDKVLRHVLNRKAMQNEDSSREAFDKRNPPVITVNQYRLSVSNYARARVGNPVERDLPPFYLPEAIGYLLPRLLPLHSPAKYMFASYVGSQRQVMSRYVDVKPEQKAQLDGQTITAIPITDRIGVDGSPTINYLSRDGQWLGSVNPSQKTTVLPSDRQSLEPMWKKQLDAALSPAVKAPAGR